MIVSRLRQKMVAAVFGSQSVENSVVSFNPQELTLVAGRAASEARAFGSPTEQLPYQPADGSAWKHRETSGPQSPLEAIPIQSNPTSLADTDGAKSATIVQNKPASSVATMLQPIHDRMPWAMRWGFGSVTAIAIAYSVRLSVLRTSIEFPHPSDLGLWVFCLIAISAAIYAVSQETMFSKFRGYSGVRRGAIMGVLLLVTPVVLQALSGVLSFRSFFLDQMAFGISFAGLLPLCALDTHEVTRPDRAKRFQWKPVFKAAGLALGFSIFFDRLLPRLGNLYPWVSGNLYIVPIAVAAGLTLVLQMVCPKQAHANSSPHVQS